MELHVARILLFKQATSTVTINISIDAITLLPNNFVAMTALTNTLVSSYMQNRIRWEIAHEVEGGCTTCVAKL